MELQLVKVEHSSNTWDFAAFLRHFQSRASPDRFNSLAILGVLLAAALFAPTKVCHLRLAVVVPGGESHRIFMPETLCPEATFIRDTNKKISGRLRLRKRPLFNLMGVNR